MFYLTTHSTHFIYGYMASDIWLRTILIMRNERERNVLFNDALNTFYLRLYGVRHMVNDHSDSEKGNPLPPHKVLLSINSKGYFICTIMVAMKTSSNRLTRTSDTNSFMKVCNNWICRLRSISWNLVTDESTLYACRCPGTT